MLSKEHSPFTQKTQNSFILNSVSDHERSRLSFDTSLIHFFVSKKGTLNTKTSDSQVCRDSEKLLEDMINLTLEDAEKKDSSRQDDATTKLVALALISSLSHVYLEQDLVKRESKQNIGETKITINNQ